jgi:Ran GTPase-activating protein (RanGAP) involved in mRNA processing and transport
MDLSFYGVSLGSEAVCALSAALQLSSAASMLTAIVLSGNRLGDAACSAALHTLLQHARRLQVLDLSSNVISGAGCAALADGLGALSY